MKKQFLALFVGFATLVTLGAGCTNSGNSGKNDQTFISVESQEIKDNKVVIKEAAIDRNGWVVIQAKENGVAGTILGYTSVAAGKTQKKIEVTIDETKLTQTLVATLYYDREPMGVFGTDGPVIINQQVIMEEFEVENYGDLTKDVAPTSAANASTNRQEFIITAKQWAFSPSSIKVKKGDTVVMKVTSADVAHGLNLAEFGINETIEPGKTKTIEFVADKVGSFTFSCSVPCGAGHKAMTGTLVVE